VPIALLPDWLESISRLVFLSWSSDLLRDALSPAPIADLAPRLLAILILGTAAYLLGVALVRRTVNRLRHTGSLSYA
jgi:ABC-2 type transport system permease protein